MTTTDTPQALNDQDSVPSKGESGGAELRLDMVAAARVAPHTQEITAIGTRYHPMTRHTLLETIFRAVVENKRLIVAAANLHGLYMAEINPDYRNLLGRDETITIIDGMPVILLLKLMGHDVSRKHRTTWIDWFEELLRRADSERRSLFILGHQQSTIDAGLARANLLFPSLRISGLSGYFAIHGQSSECNEVVATINAFQPDILILGMGMPRQEIFALRHGHQINAKVIALGGAAFAYFAGHEPTPPRWTGRWGLEWAHRLLNNPKQLASRYLIEPPLLVLLLIRRTLNASFHPPS